MRVRLCLLLREVCRLWQMANFAFPLLSLRSRKESRASTALCTSAGGLPALANGELRNPTSPRPCSPLFSARQCVLGSCWTDRQLSPHASELSAVPGNTWGSHRTGKPSSLWAGTHPPPLFQPTFPHHVHSQLPVFALQPHDGGLAAVGFLEEGLFECGLGGFKMLVGAEDFFFTLRTGRHVSVKVVEFRESCTAIFARIDFGKPFDILDQERVPLENTIDTMFWTFAGAFRWRCQITLSSAHCSGS